MTMRAIFALSCACLALMPYMARAQAGPLDDGDTGECPENASETGPQAPCPPGAAEAVEPEIVDGDDLRPNNRFFPIGGRRAIERGFRIPEPWGIGAMYVKNHTNFNSQDLSVAVSKGTAPPEDVPLIPLPAVTTRRIESDTEMAGFKADLWLFPPVNVFIAIGKVKGVNEIDVDIDLDELVPAPFCRPAKPCGTINLPFEAEVDNATITLGTILVYGSEDWFISGSAAKTLSVSSKERSDVESTNFAFRGGPRFQVGEDSFVTPYLGANYFDLQTRVRGVVSTGPIFEDGDPVNLRYDVELEASHPWALLVGMNVELTRHVTLQGEVQAGERSTRGLTTVALRF